MRMKKAMMDSFKVKIQNFRFKLEAVDFDIY